MYMYASSMLYMYMYVRLEYASRTGRLLLCFYYASSTLPLCLRSRREHSVIYTELRFVKDLVVFIDKSQLILNHSAVHA